MSINVYFYRTRNHDNVIDKWEDCAAVPRPGDTVRLGPAQAQGTVMEVCWSKPDPAGLQVADVYVNLFAVKAEPGGMIGVQIGSHGVQTNVFGR
jgi:hypothetical protein